MAWPFDTPPPPDFDTGLVEVPLVATSISTATQYILGVAFANPTAAPIFVTVTNTVGKEIIATTEVTDKLDLSRDYPYRPCEGLKWHASAAGLMGQIWGY